MTKRVIITSEEHVHDESHTILARLFEEHQEAIHFIGYTYEGGSRLVYLPANGLTNEQLAEGIDYAIRKYVRK